MEKQCVRARVCVCVCVCVPISHLPLDIIRTDCPIFDTNLFLWWRFAAAASEVETTAGKKRHEGELEKLFTKNSLSAATLVNSNCFYLCQDRMNDMKLYF